MAYIGGDADGNHTFIDITKNRKFTSAHADTEMAYNDYINSLDELKVTNCAEADLKKYNEQLDMIVVMKCVMVGYGQMLKVSEICPKSPKDIEDLFRNCNSTYLELVGPYFTTGLGSEISVNNPEQIFKICVRDHLPKIMDIICQKCRFNDRESTIFAMASSCFDEL